ncbi:MAG: hypothetical protein AB1540_02645 [Bdellovibrionota bacterium]
MIETEERKFLHDIASPVGTAIFVLDMVLDSMKNRPNANPDELAQAQQVFDVLGQIKKKIEERRQILIQQGVPSSKTS